MGSRGPGCTGHHGAPLATPALIIECRCTARPLSPSSLLTLGTPALLIKCRCTATCPLLPSPGPASSAPSRRPSFVLRPFPPAKRRSCCPPFSADRPGQRPDVLSSCTLRIVLGAGGRCRPWFRITGALRGRISTSKLVSQVCRGPHRSLLLTLERQFCSPKETRIPRHEEDVCHRNCKPLLAAQNAA
jgi:hypothetical protein